MKKFIFLLFLSIFIVLFIILNYRFVLTKIGQFLVVEDKFEYTDFLVVLSGDINSRIPEAGRLFLEGKTKYIVLLPKELSPIEERGIIEEEQVLATKLLKKMGVVSSAILKPVFNKRVTSTFDEAKFMLNFSTKFGLSRLNILTTDFHSRRAKWIFNKVFKKSNTSVNILKAECWKFSPKNWWTNEIGLITYQNEYIKLFYYLFKYSRI